MFWRPHGHKINYLTVKNGQPVEGWYKTDSNPFRQKIKNARIRIEKNESGYTDIMVDGVGYWEKRIARIWPHDDVVRFDSGHVFILYDGARLSRGSVRIDLFHRLFR